MLRRSSSNLIIIFALLLSIGTLSCADEFKELRSQLQDLSKQVRSIAKQVKTLEVETQDGFRVALCRPEVRQLLDDVSRECQPLPNAVAVVATQEKMSDVGMCDTKKIHPAVMSADPEHRGRFLKFMSLLRHEAAYLRPNMKEFIKPRRERIERLATQPLLKNTVFLIVAHPAQNEPDREVEAYKRAQLMAIKLAQYNDSIDSSRVRIWVYSFTAAKSEIDNPADLPELTEPADLSRSVWVFRADC